MKQFSFGNLIVERYTVGPLEENTYLAYEKGGKEAILVDPGSDSEEIAKSISNLLVDKLVIFVTHGHADHIAGLEFFRKKFPFAKVAVSQEDSSMLTDSYLNLSDFIIGSFVCKKADMILKQGDTLNICSHVGTVSHIPGHTQGGLALIFDEFVFSGDSLFCEGVGRSDLPGGDGKTLVASVKSKLLTLTDRTVFPGHGFETSISHEKRHNPYI